MIPRSDGVRDLEKNVLASSGSSIRHAWWAIVGDALSQEIAVELGKR